MLLFVAGAFLYRVSLSRISVAYLFQTLILTFVAFLSRSRVCLFRVYFVRLELFRAVVFDGSAGNRSRGFASGFECHPPDPFRRKGRRQKQVTESLGPPESPSPFTAATSIAVRILCRFVNSPFRQFSVSSILIVGLKVENKMVGGVVYVEGAASWRSGLNTGGYHARGESSWGRTFAD